jgi:hypothetical protein
VSDVPDTAVDRRLAGLAAPIHGGRPTFELRKEDSRYRIAEFMPTEQAEAHKHRWATVATVSRQVDISSIDPTDDEWEWGDWQAVHIASIDADQFDTLRGLLKRALEPTVHDFAQLLHSGHQRLVLPERAGVRVALAMAAIAPMQRVDRRRAIAQAIGQMSIEECYYWHSLCRSPDSPSGRRALRVLLSGHIR